MWRFCRGSDADGNERLRSDGAASGRSGTHDARNGTRAFALERGNGYHPRPVSGKEEDARLRELGGGRILPLLWKFAWPALVTMTLNTLYNVIDRVYTTFEKMWNDGLIYRGEKLVNYCPKHRTAFADIEVEHKDEKGTLWDIEYKLLEASETSIIISTTRPETLFGDTAVAVNPEDPRYKDLIGKFVKLPLTNRKIPVIADEHADPEYGTGAVKITPAHDFDDFEVGERHNLPRLQVISEDGHMMYKDHNRDEPLAILTDGDTMQILQTCSIRRFNEPKSEWGSVSGEHWYKIKYEGQEGWICSCDSFLGGMNDPYEDNRFEILETLSFAGKTWTVRKMEQTL